ncbi:hypothetical protein [Halorussus amylolyticus]|uniref:hypothetical protein n=1 Tax=Halorussus amylolyticus TaxID=1126242 RepID=UPI00104FC087|nr:hypothetical protein [Halorussus amylolyticus]
MTDGCTYCGSDIERHDPVFVNEGANAPGNQAGRFCNYACLAAYIESEELTYGTACEWEP